MSNTLKKITSKAKLLYKSGKYAKWTDAIKEASKGISTGVKKVGSVKKKVAKKKVAKKLPGRSYGNNHTDTKSHNVRINVVSGLDKVTRKGKKTTVHYTWMSGMNNELATGTKISKLVKQYLIDNIDISGYDYPAQNTDVGKLKILFEIFNQEYGWAISKYGKVKAIKEWLMGLPSSVNIYFYNEDIIELAKSWGALKMNASEKQEDKILNNYWNLLSNNLNQLFEKVKNKNIIYYK